MHISLHLSLIVKGIFYIFTKNQTQMQGNLTENGPQMKAQQNLRLVTINQIGLAMFLLVLSGHQVANATAAGVGVRAQSLGGRIERWLLRMILFIIIQPD